MVPRRSKLAETQHRPSPGWRTRSPHFACSIATRTPPHTPTAERRRAFATQLLRAGTDPVLVADLLGHSDLSTLKIYTHPNDADRERALALLTTDT
ncbi:MAG TPA: tyrosine-type recombinase/integrase [Pseudonocardiaceae bacterium]|nr:tyrosine-type recombinase/integrase [Pseudonocardiaceae bacterium]